jgi:glycosyltransferase involved in cell wall biosynthesis
MKVAHVIGSLCSGGAERIAVNLCLELARLGHAVTMITVDAWCGGEWECKAVQAMAAQGIEVLNLGRKPGTGWRGLKVVARLAARLRRARFNIIHSHLLLADTVTSLATRIARVKGSRIITVHSSHESWGRTRALIMGKPFLAYCSNAAKTAGRHPSSETVVIPNGIELNIPPASDCDLEALRRDLGLNANDKVMISVGSIKQAKNYESAIKAFAMAASQTQAQYLIVGGGETASLMSSTNSCPTLSGVRFLGERNDVPRLLQLADCFFSASTYEGMPVAVLEALAGGLPCVLSPIAEHKEIGAGMAGCYFADSNAAEDLACALQAALAQPHDKSRLREARMPMLARYDIRTCAQSYADFYLRVLAANSSMFYPCHLVPSDGRTTVLPSEMIFKPSSTDTTVTGR